MLSKKALLTVGAVALGSVAATMYRKEIKSVTKKTSKKVNQKVKSFKDSETPEKLKSKLSSLKRSANEKIYAVKTNSEKS